MFKKKTGKEKQEEAQPAPPSPMPSYGGQPDMDGGLDESGNKGGIIDKLSTGRRRFKENFAQRTGREGVDNSEFEERFHRVTELRDKIVKVRKAMKRQLECSRALCMACAELGNSCSDANVRDVQFQNAQFQLDEDLRKRLDEAIAKALESVDNKLAPFAELEKMVTSRNNLKLDYDHYVRKVRDMKEKPGADPVKMSNNEAKLTAARQRLHEATSRLYKGFGYYDAVGGKLVQPEVEMFKKAQQDFFGAALEAVKGMTARDPKEVASEVEAVGKDGMNTPFTLPTSMFDSQSTGERGSSSPSSTAPGGSSFARDSPDRTPSSAYVPSASAPWITNPGSSSNTGSGGSSFAASGGPYQSSLGGGGNGSGSGSSWWDKHASPKAESQTKTASTPAWEGGGATTSSSTAPSARLSGGKPRARALYSYTAADDTEISLVEGEILVVIIQDQSGWWTGEKGGRQGLFPSNYVELL